MTPNIKEEIDRLIHTGHYDPFRVLGLHFTASETGKEDTAIVRTFQPHAESVVLLVDGEEKYLYKMRDEGLFEISIPNCSRPFSYQFKATYYNKTTHTFYDPYRFLPQLGSIDLHLFNNGTHYELYNKFGAHLAELDSIQGTIFRVWAPSAKRVSIIGNFNTWDGRVHQMRTLGSSGIWELFIPGIYEDELYKFEIKTQGDNILVKSDPFQFYGEVRPRTASIVRSLSKYEWHDEAWLSRRRRSNPYESPVSIYEVHPGSWRRDPDDPDRFLTFRELADSLVPYVKEQGFTHVELMPVMEHPLDESWGYQVTCYFSMTSRYGLPEDFMYFVDCCHQHDIGVILDWVPAHFPMDSHSLARFDGTALYEHEDPRQGQHPEWGTLIFNYGRKEVSNFLIANALFWLDKYHIDGLRVDAVASMLYLDYARQADNWIPNYYGGHENLEAIEFIKHLNSVLYERFPNAMMVAEESTSFFGVSKPADHGGLGFGFKWNMGWMNDTLAYFSKDPIYRKHHHNSLTFSLFYAFSENFILPLSHDEIVHGKKSLIAKMPGDIWQQFANLRLLYLLLWSHPGKKLLFMGGEFGQWSEWYCKRSLDWHLIDEDERHKMLQIYVKELNTLYQHQSSLWEIDFTHLGFQWMDFQDVDNSTISFARFAKERNNHLVCVFNFTPQTHYNYKVGIPSFNKYREIFNSDAHYFGGSGVANARIAPPIHEPYGEAENHITVSLPPLAGIILQPVLNEEE
jgi:1,4-alpha-glucan branching enzyme